MEAGGLTTPSYNPLLCKDCKLYCAAPGILLEDLCNVLVARSTVRQQCDGINVPQYDVRVRLRIRLYSIGSDCLSVVRLMVNSPFLNFCAASIPPSKTTPIEEKRHELSSGTILNCRYPASPGNLTDSELSTALSASNGDSASGGGADLSRGGDGAESCASSSLTDCLRLRTGDLGGRAVTMSCSPRVMGTEARRPVVSGNGLGGYPNLTA